MKYLLFLFFIVSLSSCTKRTIPPKEIELTGRHAFIYSNSSSSFYAVMYKGIGGLKTLITEEEAQNFFIIRFDYMPIKEVVIDFNNMTLTDNFKKPEKIKLKNDSLFLTNVLGKNSPTFLGILSRDKSQFFYYKSFSFYRFQNDVKKIETSGSQIGLLTYEDLFKDGNLYFNGSDYSFLSPSDMKNKRDVVCWINRKYLFQKK